MIMATKRPTKAQVRERQQAIIDSIKRSGDFNGHFLRDIVDGKTSTEPGDAETDMLVVATARAMSVINNMAEWAYLHGPLTHEMVKAAYDGWMEGAGMKEEPTPMGSTRYVRNPEKQA